MKLPSIGKLNRRLVIKRRTDEPDGDYDVQATFDPIATVWANIEPVGGGTYYGSKQTDTTVTHRMIVRRWPETTWPSNITGDYQLECDGMSYRPHRISDANGARRFTVIEVEELGQSVAP